MKGPAVPNQSAVNARSSAGLFPAFNLTGMFTLLLLVLVNSCGPADQGSGMVDPHLSTNGTVEVTARLIEIPEGAIFKRDLYDYATVLKYDVIKVYRGHLEGTNVYVGHYNPWKSRNEAADARVRNIGGNLRQFQAGQVHHLALEVPIEEVFMGGIVDKYFGVQKRIYWAVWTNRE